MRAPLPAQASTWCEPWDPPSGQSHPAHGNITSHPQLLPPHPPLPLQTSVPAQVHPITPQWHSYLQAMPTKEDFRQLIEDVKSTCRSEIQVLQSDLKHLADRVEMAKEEIQETKLAVHRAQPQGVDHCTLLRDMQRHLEDLDNRDRRNNI